MNDHRLDAYIMKKNNVFCELSAKTCLVIQGGSAVLDDYSFSGEFANVRERFKKNARPELLLQLTAQVLPSLSIWMKCSMDDLSFSRL